MQPWKTIARRQILPHSKYLAVEEHVVELPDGRRIEDWPWVITPDFVNLMAETDQGKFIFFRQTKYAAGAVTLAPVGGYMEADEEPVQAARRELLEETGYQAEEWIPLGSFPVEANRGMGRGHFFLARRARRVTDPDSDDLEEQELLLLGQAEVEQALLQGEVKVTVWIAAIALALQWLYAQSR
jgi:ADP-ribose pyrophosphatase